MKFYTDGNVVVQAEPMSDVKYFREYDGNPRMVKFGENQMTERLITIKEVQKIVGFKKDYIYRNIKKGTFPKQINFGNRSARWRLSEVQKWVESQT